jgi:hypothetical protein
VGHRASFRERGALNLYFSPEATELRRGNEMTRWSRKDSFGEQVRLWARTTSDYSKAFTKRLRYWSRPAAHTKIDGPL